MNQNPFGQSINPEDIVDALTFFDCWEDRYKYLIDLGKELPPLADAKKDPGHLVKGCQSQVWIDCCADDGRLWFDADSDAFIVKGLLAVVLAAYNGRSPHDICAFDIEGYFDRVGLVKHLSPTRGNGLRAMVKRIQSIASDSTI